MPQRIVDLLNSAIEADRTNRFRTGNIIKPPSEAEIIVTGDIHGHRRNFEKTIAFANLQKFSNRHLILQEIIHGGPENSHGGCISYQLLFDAIRYKMRFPERVHIIMGNHDTSYINDSEVMKNGREMNRAMRSAIDMEFGADSERVKQTLKNYILSQPLAVKCANRIWISHSLPTKRFLDKFDKEIFDRPLEQADTTKPGSVYLLTWGRRHSQALLDEMSEKLDVDIFVLGHQPQDQGFSIAGRNLIILSSEHNHGCLLPIDLSKSYTIEALADAIVPLASVMDR